MLGFIYYLTTVICVAIIYATFFDVEEPKR